MSYSRASILRWGLRAILLLGLLAATTGVTDTPAVAATPRAALPAQTTPAGSLSRAVADDHKDGQGRDDDEDNEADGVSETQDDILDELGPVGRGVSNIIRLRNHQDGRLRIRGNIDLNRIYGPHIEPRNAAMATATCTDCQTVVVA